MIRAVVDTNALASGFVNRAGPSGRILQLWRHDAFALCISTHIITELKRTLAKPYFAARLTADQQRRAVALLLDAALLIELPGTAAEHATRPPDDLVLETAVRADADYLVTGDRALLDRAAHEGVLIVSPRRFLEVLLQQGEATKQN